MLIIVWYFVYAILFAVKIEKENARKMPKETKRNRKKRVEEKKVVWKVKRFQHNARPARRARERENERKKNRTKKIIKIRIQIFWFWNVSIRLIPPFLLSVRDVRVERHNVKRARQTHEHTHTTNGISNKQKKSIKSRCCVCLKYENYDLLSLIWMDWLLLSLLTSPPTNATTNAIQFKCDCFWTLFWNRLIDSQQCSIRVPPSIVCLERPVVNFHQDKLSHSTRNVVHVCLEARNTVMHVTCLVHFRDSYTKHLCVSIGEISKNERNDSQTLVWRERLLN